MRKNLAAFCIVGLLAMGGCGDSAPGPKAGAGKSGRLIGVSFQTMNNPFFVELNDGLKKVVEAHGDSLKTLDAQYDSLKQLKDVSDLIQQNAAAIFINPVNWDGIKGSLLQARDKKIPIIIVDAPVADPELVLCTVASDNVEAGRLAARELAGAVPAARIVVLNLPTNKACIDRVDGFNEELKKHAGATVLGAQNGGGETEKALPVMRDLMGRYPDLNAVFAINDPSALGVISALESSGKLSGVKVVSVDGSDAAKAKIKEGKLLSTSAQFPGEIGRISAEQAYRHFEGKAVEKDVKVNVELINQKSLLSK